MSVHWGGRGPGHTSRRTKKVGEGGSPSLPAIVTPPSIAGTLSNGSTITCTPGVWSTGTATRQWYRDGTPISGQTGLTYTYASATDDGCYLSCVETNGAATSMSNALIGLRNLTYYNQNFNAAADGTQLHGYDGWTCTGPGEYSRITIRGGDLNTEGGLSGNTVWTHAAGSNDMSVSMTYKRHSGNYVQSNARILILRYANEGTYLYLDITDHFLNLQKKISYGSSSASGQIAVDLQDNDVITAEAVGDFCKVFVNGIRVGDVSVNSGQGYDVSAVPKTAVFGIRQDATTGGGATSYPFPIIKALKVDTPAANSIALGAMSVDNPSTNPGGQRIHVTGTVAGSVTQIQYLLVHATTGRLIQDWTNASGQPSGGVIDFYITNPPEADNATPYRVWIRDATNKNTAVSGTATTVGFQEIFPTRIGMNEGYLNAYMNAIPYRDKFFSADWRAGSTIFISQKDVPAEQFGKFDGSGVPLIKTFTNVKVTATVPTLGLVTLSASRNITPGNAADAAPTTPAGNAAWSVFAYPASKFNMGYDGIIKPNASGVTTYRSYLPRYWTPGNYEFFYPAGMTCSLNYEAGDVTVLTPFSGGYGKIQVNIPKPNNNAGVGFMWLDFSGTIPPEGLIYSIRKEGDTSTVAQSDEYLASWQSLSPNIMRFMTAQHTNNLEFRTGNNQVWTGSVDAGPLSTQFMCETVNAVPGADLYLCIGAAWDDDYIQKTAEDVLLYLDPDRKVYVEWSNEVWNGLFPQFSYAACRGCELGLATQNGGQTPIPAVYEGVFDGSGIPCESWPINTYVYGNVPTGGVGFVVMKSKKAITAGAAGDVAVSSGQTSNTGWDLIYTNTDTTYARRHYTTHRSLEVFAIFDAVFGSAARSRVRRVIAGQAGGGAASQFELLSWEDAYLHCDRFAVAPYWGGGIAGYNVGSYSSDFTGWTATEKALVATDVPAFLTAAFAAFNTAIDGTIAYMKTWKQDFARLVAAKPGGSIDLVPLMSYEAGWHWYTQGAWNSAINTVFPQIITDARFGTAVTRYLNGLRDNIGGDHVLFDRLAAVETGQGSNWGYQSDEGDITSSNARFTAVKDFIAAL